MKLLMKRRSVERIADTKESYDKLIKLGYTVKKDLEKENAADTTEEKTEETGTGAKEPENHDTASDEKETVIPEEAEEADTAVPAKTEAEKPKKPKSGKREAEQEAK